MTKSDLLGIFRTAKNNYRLVYVLIILSSQDKMKSDFMQIYQGLDKSLKPVDDILPLLFDEKVFSHALMELQMTIHRASLKELFETMKHYCDQSSQSNLLTSQTWYQFWRIIRNCFSHNFKFRFNNYDKTVLPVTWAGITIAESMEGQSLNIGQFSIPKLWALIGEAEDFIDKQLA
jgi:hypothetical protein